MITKAKNYLLPYKHYHICNNKLYNIGQLNGIRNYIKCGNISDSDKLWLSYKYKTVYDDYLSTLILQSKFVFEFSPYNLDRVKKHMIYDNADELVDLQIMKYKNQGCPFSESIKTMLNCSCPRTEMCSGFCTFPVSGQMVTNLKNINPGIVWDKNNISTFHITSNTYDAELFANTNIDVNDDLEIYFIPSRTIRILFT